MICPECKKEVTRIKTLGDGKWGCSDCIYVPMLNNVLFNTVNYPEYKKNNGNVSKSRIDMIKSRCLSPDGNGEVVMKKNGKITDRRAYNY